MSSNQRLFVILAALFISGIVTVGGLIVTKSAVDDTSGIVATLQYNATRGDCIRQVTADAEELFRRDIGDLLDVGRNEQAFARVRARMRSRPNYADTVKDRCPPAIQQP